MSCKVSMKVLNVCASLIMLQAISAQFLEQPDPGTVLTLVDEEVTLTCSVEEGYLINWHVMFANGHESDASNGIDLEFLLQQNFTLDGVGSTRSVLSLRETESQTNNGTNITCIAHDASAPTKPILGSSVVVIFYGVPPPPSDLNVIENGLFSLNISWYLEFIEGVPVNYTLEVLNLITSAQPIIIAGLLDQHYVFATSRPCDVYSFTVTAVTAAGNSTPSQEIIFARNRETCSITTTTTATTTEENTLLITVSTTPSNVTQVVTFNPSMQENSIIPLVIIISVVVVLLLGILMLINTVVCVFCNKKNKPVTLADPADPVYETPENVIPISCDKHIYQPFAMTTSAAYGVSEGLQKSSAKDIESEKSNVDSTA